MAQKSFFTSPPTQGPLKKKIVAKFFVNYMW